MTDETVTETPEENATEVIEKKEDDNIEIPVLTKDKSKYILDQLDGMIFKVDDAFFEVKYCNVGQRRFTATMINDIKG